MGFFKTLGKIIFFPVYVPYKIGKKVIGSRPQESPIVSIVEASNPEAYSYYFEGSGHKTDVIGNKIIVWREGISNGERQKVLEKLSQVI